MNPPVIVTTHLHNGTFQHYSWSPNEYNLEMHGHPMEHPDYENLMNRVLTHIEEHEEFSEFHHMHTDFHCITPVNNRGHTSYFSISNDHVVSPILFSIIAMSNYVTNHPAHNTVYICQHLYI
jgi:hypothetical protein